MPTKKRIIEPALRTWIDLNDALREADVVECRRLLKLEKAGRARRQFISRIYSRLNKVRADQEREALGVAM